MTFKGRSADDLPLAAYGGSRMELTPEDESKFETGPSPSAPDGADAPEPLASGPFAHAVPGAALPDDNFGAGRPTPTRELPPVVTKAVTALRTSRLAAGAGFVGVILIGLLLLTGGQKPGAAGAEASPSAGPVAAVTAEPGNATLVVVAKTEQSLAFGGMTGAGAPAAPIAATWTDATLNSLGLQGAADRGTRTTNESLVLTFTVAIDGKPVTFTSTEGECTIGMAVHPRNVSGTFSCKKLKSDDGKVTVGATGTYRT